VKRDDTVRPPSRQWPNSSQISGRTEYLRITSTAPGLFEQVVNDGLLLPVDPAGEEQNDERERRRQRVHDAKRAPRGCGGARRVRFEHYAPSQFAELQGDSIGRSPRIHGLSRDSVWIGFSHTTGSNSTIAADGPYRVDCVGGIEVRANALDSPSTTSALPPPQALFRDAVDRSEGARP
jgi:hypothetical protein